MLTLNVSDASMFPKKNCSVRSKRRDQYQRVTIKVMFKFEHLMRYKHEETFKSHVLVEFFSKYV